MTNQEIIMRFFNSWITKDFSRLDDYFNQNAIYVESYGPWYQGLDEIKAWINHKKKMQTV
ncbi:nuclear transport factor 2 family protein [Lactobacillus sp. YT155]|uniref:nuclear transport factor 2 family protein n=1 Tax=Lactobacillus sp. YT155 TaxID=3060955 RepID=UPI00265F9E54|nr:nuclear transport factor 2 family protein [Lactobacillus sp. YT155]MDO1605033.1 nuclear transport factor 2 family protein [Lactobacillus sp. YT155]